MKFGELVTVFSVLFLVTFSMGDGAPQWRPQGRFGKRLDQRFPSPWQQSKYTHNINFTLHLFKTYCSQKKIGIGFWSVYHLFTITVKIPFFNMFDHKLPIWEFNTSHTILKKKPVDCLLYSVVRFLKQKHLQYVYFIFFSLSFRHRQRRRRLSRFGRTDGRTGQQCGQYHQCVKESLCGEQRTGSF